MHYAHKKFTVTANEVEEDGMVDTMYANGVPVFKGNVLLCDLEGNTFAITTERFQEYYVPVNLVKSGHKRKLSPFEEQYAKQLQEFQLDSVTEDEQYITKTKEIVENKPL